MLSVKLEFKVRKNILAGLKYDFPHWLDGNKVSLSLGTRGLDTMKPPFFGVKHQSWETAICRKYLLTGVRVPPF